MYGRIIKKNQAFYVFYISYFAKVYEKAVIMKTNGDSANKKAFS